MIHNEKKSLYNVNNIHQNIMIIQNDTTINKFNKRTKP